MKIGDTVRVVADGYGVDGDDWLGLTGKIVKIDNRSVGVDFGRCIDFGDSWTWTLDVLPRRTGRIFGKDCLRLVKVVEVDKEYESLLI